MITVVRVDKTYRGIDLDRKEGGIALWIKNIHLLTSNKASSTPALRDVSFDVKPGEIFGIYGANGAGKTTLIKILSGLLIQDQGDVQVNGLQGHTAIKDQISYISTNGWMALEWQLTVLENLRLYGQLFGLHGKLLRQRCEQVLRTFEMTYAQHRQISQLSAGMRQRVTLMRGLLMDRPVLYLDEPTVSLDVLSSALLREIMLRESRESGRTVIITSHQPVDLSICDRILFLHRGYVVGLDTPNALTEPLHGISALHLNIKLPSNVTSPDLLMEDLRALPVVQELKPVNEGGGRRAWSVKLLLRGANPGTGAIVDTLLKHHCTLMKMELHQTTLQELYEYYVAKNASNH